MPAVTTPLLNGANPPANSFVLPKQKMVYMSVTKVACTSLRWMVADLAGEDLEAFTRAGGAQQSRLMTIHGGRSRWKKTQQLSTMPLSELEKISPEDGWFVFAVVRDPWSRLWSAWQSKFLVRHTYYMDHYADEPWFPRVATTSEQVLEDYRKFVFARPWETHPNLRRDVHFWPQVRSVRPGAINYTKIYNLSEMSSLFSDIRGHLESLGQPSELYVPRANETPLAMTPEVLEGGVLEAVQDAYSRDFAAFGDRWDPERLKLAPSGWTQDALDHAAFHTVANQRIGDLRNELRSAREQLDESRKEVRKLTREQPPVQRAATNSVLWSMRSRSGVAGLVRKLRRSRPVRRIVRKLKS
jgi:hypothetical protein